MRFEWVLSLADYRAAQNLHNRSSLVRRSRVFTFRWLIPFLALLSLLSILFTYFTTRRTDVFLHDLSTTLPFFLFVVVFRVFYKWSTRASYKRLFLNGDSSKPLYMDVDEHRVLSGIPGSGEGKFFWSTILNFAEDDRIALVYISKQMFLMIPKKKLSPAAWADLRGTILRHMPSARNS